jgi:hypothetical protein
MVSAFPTKKFFMSMLTRDIALSDAIMDLLDNCIDGIHRQLKDKVRATSEPYSGFFGEIIIDDSHFILKDNCGGIPLKTAINYAFKMGRSEEYHDDDNMETVGMYGIGMKRAIFKMGLEAEIFSFHSENQFKVQIPTNWSEQPDWFFEYLEIPKADIIQLLPSEGTLIKIGSLHDNIKKQFADKATFIKNLTTELRNHYGYIIQQGFKISINGIDIEPLELNILTSEINTNKSIKPYVYTSKIYDVDVEVIVGFYRSPASNDEIEHELEGDFAKSSSENAGITVICNDRVVLYCDKSYLTGWGELPVPKYHTQFIAIAGVVHFRSNNPILLPVTTTKRGLDTSSALYAEVKNKIKEGLKIFTSFTNNWKTPSEERSKLFDNTLKINVLKPGQAKSSHITLSRTKRDDPGHYQIPTLPKPNDEIREKFIVISFQREREKVEGIANYFLSGQAKSAAEVGGWCFDEIYNQIDTDL